MTAGSDPGTSRHRGQTPVTRRIKVAIIATFLTAACGGAPQQVSESGQGAYEASLTPIGNGYAVAWHDIRDGQSEIYLRQLDGSGEPAGPERRLTNDPALSYEANIQAAGENLAVSWYDKDTDGKLQARVGLFSPDGQGRWSHALSSTGRNSRNPVVRVRGREIFVAWIEDVDPQQSEVMAGWWDLEGKPLSPPRALGPASPTTWNVNAVVEPNGSAWVVFDARTGTRSDEIFMARAGKTSSEIVRLTGDDGVPSKYPDVALGGTRAALTWYDERDGNQEVYLSVAPIHQLSDQSARRVTNTAGHSIGAYAAWSGQRLGLAWSDDSAGQHEIYFQPFGANGAPLDDPTRLTDNPTSSLIPSIQPAGNGFALAWNEYETAPQPDANPTAQPAGKSEIAFTSVD